MRELNQDCGTPQGMDCAKFANVLKFAPKLINLNLLNGLKRKACHFGTLVAIPLLVLSSFAPISRYGDGSGVGLKKVVIDAGHGGKDPGTLGVNGLKEKTVVLDIALKLGKKIKQNYPEVEVVYTRDNDEFIPLHERAKIANGMDADLFISIHANAAGSPSAHGTECFVLGLHRTKENFEVAKRENSAILMEENYEVKYDGFDPKSDESYIALTLQQSVFLDQSLNIASKVQNEFSKSGYRNRGVRQAGFIVLYKTTMPSILVEVGFVTNPTEGKNLATEPYREKITKSIYEAFIRYKNEIDGRARLTASSSNHDEAAVKNTEREAEMASASVVFKVQIASLPEPKEIKPENFKGLNNVSEFKTPNSYKYMVGHETDFDKAIDLQGEIRKKAYEDAFIVAFHKGEKISISQAIKILETNP